MHQRPNLLHIWLVVFSMLGFSLSGSLQVQAPNREKVAGPRASESMNIVNGPVQGNLYQQETDEAKCWPLNMILLIDQSHSMWDFKLSAVPNDPAGYRFRAAKEVLRELIRNRRDQCPKALHRFAVIGYGKEAKTIVPMIDIDITRDDDVELWSAPIRAMIEDAVHHENQVYQDYTDPRIAFQAADKMITDLPQVDDPQEYGLRRTVVVMLTDGFPTGEYLNGKYGAINSSDIPKYMCRTTEYLNGPAWPEVHFWFVALKDNDTPSYLNLEGCNGQTIGSNWEDIVKKHNGKLYKNPYNEQYIPLVLREIVDAEFGMPGERIVCSDPFYIDPYLREIELNFYRREDEKNTNLLVTIYKVKDDDDSQIIYKVKGQNEEHLVRNPDDVMQLKDYEVTEDGSERFVFDRPLPGKWFFKVESVDKSQCQRLIAAIKHRWQPQVELIYPKDRQVLSVYPQAPFHRPENPQPFTIRLSSEYGDIPRYDGYDLNVDLSYELPSKKDQLPDGTAVAPLRLFWDSQGQWTTGDNPVLTPEIGVYNVKVVGKSTDGQKDQEVTIFNLLGRYEARDLDVFGFALDTPGANQVLPCNNVVQNQRVTTSISVKVNFLDQNGVVADPARFLTHDSVQNAFQAVLRDDLSEVIDTVTLKPAVNAPGVYEGVLLANATNNLKCGMNQLEVMFGGKYDPLRYTVPYTSTAQILNRVETNAAVLKIFRQPEAVSQLHPKFCSRAATDAQIEISLVDLDGKPLDPRAIAAGDPAALYHIRLVSPDPEKFEDLQPTIEERGAQVYVLSVSGGQNFTDSGEYQFVITPNAEAFKTGYTPAEVQPVIVAFQRKDSILTATVTCTVARGGGYLTLALLAGIAIFLFTGGPGGRIELTRRGNPNDVLTSFKLSKARLFSNKRIKNAELPNITKIHYGKTRGIDNNPAVNVTGYDSENEVFFSSIVEKDEPAPFEEEVDIIYHR